MECELPLFPLNVVLFPGMRLPLHIFEDRYKRMISDCLAAEQAFGVALIHHGTEVGGRAETTSLGTTARILEVERLAEGRLNLVTVGVDRFRLVERLDDRLYPFGRVQLLPDRDEPVPGELCARVTQRFRRYLVGQGVPVPRADGLELPDEPLALSYVVGAALKLPARRRQLLLEAASALSRLRLELAALEWEAGGPLQPNARAFSVN